jgi:hypothetical protein
MLEKTTYVLIDYENVQPKDFAVLAGDSFKVKVILGPKQTKIPLSTVRAIQRLGHNAEYLHLKTGGPEALDLLIAYHIGALSSCEPSAAFHIISKDKGYDPLIAHLKERGVSVKRSESIDATSALKVACPPAMEEHVRLAIDHLVGLKAAKPRTEKTLRSSLHARFNKKHSEQQLADLVEALRKRGVIKIEDRKLSYNLAA